LAHVTALDGAEQQARQRCGPCPDETPLRHPARRGHTGV